MGFGIGQIVKAKLDVTEPANEDHPPVFWCRKGCQLEVLSVVRDMYCVAIPNTDTEFWVFAHEVEADGHTEGDE